MGGKDRGNSGGENKEEKVILDEASI